jgi:probable rRNA maturation factor
MGSKSKVYFFFDNTRISLNNRSALKKFIEFTFKTEKKKLGSLNYIFCSDKRLLEINQQYLAHDYFTDIITFDLSENESEIKGEIYISVDRVRNNAKIERDLLSNEFLRVIFHGVLHLCGYGDKKKAEKALMREKEDFYINKYLKQRST